jgi:HTH-type transcriptional regulator/antitoxin PezA
MSDDLLDLINTKIYLVGTFEEVERYNGYLDSIDRILEIARHQVIA